jgi:hypothetical protein
MSINGVGNQPTTSYVSNTDSSPVQSPIGSQGVKVIDPSSVKAGYSEEEQRVFDEFSSGMPPPGWPPAQSSPDAKQTLQELDELVRAAGASPLSTEGQITMNQAMRMLKELMIKNRMGELSLRDQQIAQIYELKLKAIEKDKEAADAAFTAAMIRGGAGLASAGINLRGGFMQGKSVFNGVSAEGSQAIGLKTQGMAAGATAIGDIAAAFWDKKAATLRAEGDALRAQADKISSQLSQTNELFALYREIFLDLQSTEKSNLDVTYQALNKRISA